MLSGQKTKNSDAFRARRAYLSRGISDSGNLGNGSLVDDNLKNCLTGRTHVIIFLSNSQKDLIMTDQLSIAMQMPDDGVQKGSRKQPSSLTSQIAALDTGECCSKIVAVDKDSLSNLSTIKKGLSDGAYSSVKGAKNRNGMADAEFSIETSHTITTSGHIYAMAIIKRIK